VTPPAHLAPPSDGSFDDAPSWSPDGRSLLYRRDLHTTRRSLWIISLDTGSKVQVGPDAPNDLFEAYDAPEWSPDGGSIVFSGRPSDAPRTLEGAGRSALWSMSIDGTEITRLTDGTRADYAPEFSPDGSRIAFARGRAEGGGAVLTMDRDGTDIAPVFVGAPPGARESPVPGTFRVAWSPDGRDFALAYREDLYTLRSGSTELEWRGQAGPPVGIGSVFSQLQWTDEGQPALIYSLPMEGRPLQRLELTGPPRPAADLTAPLTNPGNRPYVGGDEDPDWRPSLRSTVPPDAQPPVVLPVAAGERGAAAADVSAGAALAVRRRNLGFMAIDAAGVRRVEVTIARRSRAHGIRVCRFAGPRGLGRRRTCSRPAWRRLQDVADLRRLVRRLGPATYVTRLRATDGVGNRTTRPAAVRLRLRR
jgi:hypothetical protein